MSLRKTTLIIIVFCFTILVAVIFTTTRNITYNKFNELENKLTLSNLNRSVNGLSAIVSNIDVLVKDWAFWDDTYLFVQGKKDDYIDSNLPVETFINHQNNIMLFLNSKKELFWGKYLPPSGEELVPLPDGVLESMQGFLKNVKSFDDNSIFNEDETSFSGVVLLGTKLYLASCGPIFKSSKKGPQAGWIVMAREIDERVIKDLEERTELDLEFFRIGEKNISAQLSKRVESLFLNKSLSNKSLSTGMTQFKDMTPLIEKDDHQIVCSIIIKDIEENSVAVISVKGTRDIFRSGVDSSNILLITIIITGIFMGCLSLFLLEKRVVKRILQLNDEVDAVAKDRSHKLAGISGSDEIASLSKSIQEMLNKIRESESFFSQILEAIPSGIVLIDEESGEIKQISKAALRMIGKEDKDLIDSRCIQFLLPYPFEIFDKSDGCNSSSQILIKSMESTLITEQGEEIPVIRSVARIIQDGKPILLEMFLDFTELHAIQQALQKSEERYKTLFMNTGNATILMAEDFTIILANQEFINLAKAPENESLIGRSCKDFFLPEEEKRIMAFQQLRSMGMTDSAPRSYEARFKDYSGYEHVISMTVATLPGTTVSICSMFDITDWKKAEEALARKAFFDTLTNLPNRQLFNNRLEHALDFARRNGTMVGVFMLDIDDFKNVNDSMGHQAGDKVLKEIALRLNKHIRKTDTLSRLGGDEFTLIVQDVDDVRYLFKIADTIIEDFKMPFSINNIDFYLGISIGIAVFPNDGDDSENLLKNADLAMYQSKRQGKNRYRIFREELNQQARFRIALERDLRQAIAMENFEVYYQPKIFLQNGEIYGMEALVRGKREDGSIIPPNQFIPFAEESGLIVPLDLFVLKKACTDTARWINQNKRELVVSVNISTKHFHADGFVESVKEILKISGLPPSALELEVTETALMKDISQAIASIEQLNDMGISFSLDDFGTGYSSLYYLSNLPFQTLKIDKSFIDNIADNENNSSELVKIIISLAGNMNMKVVAEGVERQEQFDCLRLLGCDQIQGYLVSKPMPAYKFESFLFDYKPLIF